MKPIYKFQILFLAVFFIISVDSFGQKRKSDPTYSIHNYKHPNKAAAAAKADVREQLEIQYIQGIAPVINYKAQNRIIGREPQMVAVVRNTGKKYPGNYKQQFAPRGKNN